MKKFIIFSLVFLFSTNCYSQARVNRPEIIFENQSEVLNQATGWSYNSDLGEWVDHVNAISSELRIRHGPSRLAQNFIEMQFKTVNVNNEKYYVLIVRKQRGAYMYPEIYEDWFRWVEIFGYIFTKTQYNKIWDFDATGSVIKIVTKQWTSVRRENADTLLDMIQTNLLSDEKWGVCTFPIMKASVENEEFIRFYVPECSYGNDYDSFINFDKEYFEVTISEFDKLKVAD